MSYIEALASGTQAGAAAMSEATYVLGKASIASKEGIKLQYWSPNVVISSMKRESKIDRLQPCAGTNPISRFGSTATHLARRRMSFWMDS